MRLSEDECLKIVSTIRQVDHAAEAYLYGSRTDDSRKGGDIDLVVVSSSLEFGDRLDLLSKLKEKLGDQKIDLKVVSSLEDDDPFLVSVRSQLVRLG